MCAAPGGKTLVLAGQMLAAGDEAGGDSDDRSLLVANERSAPRRARFRQMLSEFVPPPLLLEPSELLAGGGGIGADGIVVTGADGVQWGRGDAWAGAFDRILIDAPCSSERHFLLAATARTAGQPDGVAWTPSRLKRDAKLQLAMLRNGARLLAAGGRMVFSTCSLAHEQTDGVVRALLSHRRHGAGLRLADALGGPLCEASVAPLLDGVERSECGARMLPDRSRFGPLFWAVIERDQLGC